ncbi:ribonuclease H family protein [Brucella pituitosa]|nr:ribonuclease H [Brucella pituitosa]
MIENLPMPASIRERLMSVVSGRHYLIATDGSCIRNPGRGGWSYVKQLKEGDKLLRQGVNARQSSERVTTNIKMEMTAALKAVKGIAETETPVIIVSDNLMLCKGMTEWLPGWKAKGWRRTTGALENSGLWKSLDAACEGKNVHWVWVKGHAGYQLNEMADTLARNAAEGKYPNGPDSVKAMYPHWFEDQTGVL